MVTTRKSDKGETLQELPASGKIQPEPQQRPAKRAKTAKPLQEADEEIEKAIEATYAKEKEQLTQEDEEMATKQAEKAMGDEPEYKPSREEEAEDEAEEREAEEEMEASAVPAEEALQEKGEVEGAAGLEEEQTIDMQGKTVSSPEEEEEEEEEATGSEVGQVAPDFTLQDQDGNDVSLKAFRGKIVALYFYNKDDSAIVSKGGKAFNKLVPEMKKLGGELLFIGPDSVSSHKKFKEKAKLNFPLLSDAKKEVAKQFRCLRGRNVMRCTLLLDPKGVVLKTWKDIDVEEVESNPVEALNWLKQHLPAMQQQQMTA